MESISSFKRKFIDNNLFNSSENDNYNCLITNSNYYGGQYSLYNFSKLQYRDTLFYQTNGNYRGLTIKKRNIL